MSHERSSSLSTTFSSEPEQNRDFNFTLIPIITKLLNNIIALKRSNAVVTIIGYKLYIDNEEYKIYENYIIGDYLENYFCYNNTSLH